MNVDLSSGIAQAFSLPLESIASVQRVLTDTADSYTILYGGSGAVTQLNRQPNGTWQVFMWLNSIVKSPSIVISNVTMPDKAVQYLNTMVPTASAGGLLTDTLQTVTDSVVQSVMPGTTAAGVPTDPFDLEMDAEEEYSDGIFGGARRKQPSKSKLRSKRK